MASFTTRPAEDRDLPTLWRIFGHAVEHSTASFEMDPPGLDYWRERLATDDPRNHLIVAVDEDDQPVGFASSTPYRPRPAYEFTRETSIYLDASVHGRGIGRLLYADLFHALAGSGVRSAVALIALPNAASERLHEAVGFERVGVLREVGRKFDRWIDVASYQRILVD